MIRSKKRREDLEEAWRKQHFGRSIQKGTLWKKQSEGNHRLKQRPQRQEDKRRRKDHSLDRLDKTRKDNERVSAFQMRHLKMRHRQIRIWKQTGTSLKKRLAQEWQF